MQSKIGVCIIHGRILYTGKYGTSLKKENPFFRQLIKKNLVKNCLVKKNYLVKKKLIETNN